MDRVENSYRLTSGRTFWADGGCVSLDSESNICQGYSSRVWVKVGAHDVDAEAVLTTEERAEVAVEMVARWKKWGGIP